MNTIFLTLKFKVFKYKVSCIMSVGHTYNVGNYTDTLRSIGHNFLKTRGGMFQYGHYAYYCYQLSRVIN